MQISFGFHSGTLASVAFSFGEVVRQKSHRLVAAPQTCAKSCALNELQGVSLAALKCWDTSDATAGFSLSIAECNNCQIRRSATACLHCGWSFQKLMWVRCENNECWFWSAICCLLFPVRLIACLENIWWDGCIDKFPAQSEHRPNQQHNNSASNHADQILEQIWHFVE